MSMSSEDAANLSGLSESGSHSEWNLRIQYDRLSKELHTVKRHNQELKGAYDKSVRDYKIACDARHHAQNQLSQVKTDMESLKAHTSKVESDNSMYKQQLIDSSHQAHHKYESNEMLNRMIDTAVERYNSLKSEMDQLRELYRSQTDDNHRMKMMYESKCDELSKDRTDMQILRSQCTAVTQKWQSMGQENLELEKSNKALKQEVDKLAKDIGNLMKLKDHELAVLRREKDELAKNHNLVMSERDNVHKEMDMLTERIADGNTKVNQLEHERKQMSDMIATYRHEIQSALHDRDQAQKHMRELKECVGQMLKEPASSPSDTTNVDSKTWSRLLQVSRHDRNEVNEEMLGGLSAPSYDMNESPPDVHSSKEVEMLKRDIASLQKELTEAKNDAAISIKRRDWAFSERDKIVQERESIRRQCDELRRERDRAVSNHAEELRTLDELKKFKLATSHELTEMRERLDKEERKNNLTAGSNSRDSAIDNDFQDWDTETLDFEIDISGGYHTDLGIDISYGGGDVSDSSLYINSITKGSPCDGKLRVNDVLLRINNVDAANASRDAVMETIHAASSTINFRVRRKKSTGRFNIPVELHFNKKDPGLQLETGVYISKILPGSSLAREGNIAAGDRVLSVNNKSVEHKTAKEVMKMIEGSGDFVVLNIGKYGVVPTDSSSNGSAAAGTISHGIFEKVKSKFTRGSGGSEKNLSNKQPQQQHAVADTGTGTSKRQKPQIGTKQIQNFLSIFKGPRSNDEDDEPDTIKVRTDHVMEILDRINQDYTDYDGPLPPPGSSSHMGTDGVDVSTHGTVTFKIKQNSKPAIPDSFVDHNQVYSNNRLRRNSGDHMSGRPPDPQAVRHSSYMSHSMMSPMERMGMGGSKLPGHRHTPLYEPRVQTLPTPNGSRRHVPAIVAEKSKSLEGHVSSRGSHHGGGANGEYNKPFYPADSDVHSLDQAVKELKDTRAAAKRPRPISLQHHQFSGSRSMTPSDLGRAMPSSPSRRNRPYTPESPLSHNYGGFPDSRPSSVASQPTTSSRSNSSSGQMFFSAPSNPHRIVHPACSPPPPYSTADRLYNPPSAILYEDRYHNNRDSNSSPVSAYQSQTLDRKFAPGSNHIHHAVPVRSSSSTDYSTARVKFPSNHSVSSNRKSLNSNSLEIVSSGRSSPLSSPGFYNQHSEEYIRDVRSGKLKEGVLREVELDTSFEHLGITIQEQPGTGIFITSVSHNSLAAEVGIEVGDQIIEFCGINMRTAKYDTAASVLGSWQSGDGKVKMKVQYNPKRCKHFPEQSNEVDKNSVTGSIQKIHTYMENVPQQKKPLYVVHSNGSSTDESRPEPSRNIVVQRTTQEVGIRLCGGNATGVFVADIFQESPFAGSDLQVGDQILVINGKNMKGATAEQVATELNRPSEILSLVAQYNINKYSMIHAGGDHFYVRSHFKYDAENANELSIAPGDLFLVENSLLYGQIGKWYVCKIDERDNRVGSGGIVPSRIKMEESYSLKRSYSDVMPDDDSKTSKRNGSIGRRSFFKRRSGRHQHQRSGSKDSRELTSFSDLSTSSDNVPIADDGAPLLYQRVEKIQCSHPRPVIILGPFAQALIQKLVNESPDKYSIEEEFLNTVNTVIEKGIADGVFVDYKKVNDLFKVTRTQTLHEIAAVNRHCLLMAHPSAIERMHKCKLYPIVIYIRHKSLKQIREVKDPRFLPEHLSSKSAKELFDYFSKIEVEYKGLFTVEVQGANMAAMHQNIKRVVDEEHEKNVWL